MSAYAPVVLAALLAAVLAACTWAQTFLAPSPRLSSKAQLNAHSRGRSNSTLQCPARAEQAVPAAPLALAMASLGALAASVARRRGQGAHSRSSMVACRATVAQWNSRVKRIEGGRAIFDVTITKPLGITPKEFPNRPGVGIAGIKTGGNTDLWNKEVLLNDAEGMFVLEGDEVVAVNGTFCEGGDLKTVSKLVKESEGDSVTLKLVRNYLRGPVKIVWKPSLKMATYKRKALLRACEETLGANVRYSCEDGWCSSCWHAEETYMTVFRICKMDVPEKWDNVVPFVLLSALEVKNTKGVLVKNLMRLVCKPFRPGVCGSPKHDMPVC
ncbi:unnamed protein product [Symbiodinium sp. CCMP2592]|nr:unnamed protein product [Symbiodinium sp. CCMP2592]